MYDSTSICRDLADTRKRGFFDETDFVLGMHFIKVGMAHREYEIPKRLPPGLYRQASDKRPLSAGGAQLELGASLSRVPSVTSVLGRPGSIKRPERPSSLRASTPTPTTPAFSRTEPEPTGEPSLGAAAVDWDISAHEKAVSDGFFAKLDPQETGKISGQVAVPFLGQSGLPPMILGSIWCAQVFIEIFE